MEGYIAAIVVSGAALTVPRAKRTLTSALIRALLLLLSVLSLVGVVWSFALAEWLTTTWALGLLASCVAVGGPALFPVTLIRTTSVVALTLAVVALSLTLAALFFPTSGWVFAADLARVPYRSDVPFVLCGDALLSLTAMAIAASRLLAN